ncbi:hypothetical protein [Picosynechococcus sp. PCC 7003]|nr:hypothetical protein [Picosynechococcus sp. PCC 7003]
MKNRQFGAVVKKAIAPQQVVAAQNSYGDTGFKKGKKAIAEAQNLLANP